MNSSKVTIAAFVIGSALAGLSAGIWIELRHCKSSMGVTPVNSLIAAVLGGLAM